MIDPENSYPQTAKLLNVMMKVLLSLFENDAYIVAEEILERMVAEEYEVDPDTFHIYLFSYVEVDEFEEAVSFMLNTHEKMENRGVKPFDRRSVEALVSVMLGEQEFDTATRILKWAGEKGYAIGEIGEMERVVEDFD